jgi:hypothetical protein
MKKNQHQNKTSGASLRGIAFHTLLALAAFAAVGGPGTVPALHGGESAALETDHTFPDIENWGGSNWQAAGWPAIRIKKVRLERATIVQLAFDSVSPYNTGAGPDFLLRVQLDGRFVFLTNSKAVAAGKPGAILMQKKGRVFEGKLPRGGLLSEAAVDFGKETVHFPNELNPGNANNPRFTSIRFIPGSDTAADSTAAAVWEPVSLGIPAYNGGSNWIAASWPGARGKIVGKNAVVRIGYDANSIYRGGAETPKQNFLCRLVFSGGALFLSNNPEVARRKGDVAIMEQKDGWFEASVSGLGELKEAAVDFGESSLAYGRGVWILNAKNKAEVRFNSLKIFPAAEAQPAPSVPHAGKPAKNLKIKSEYSTPAYYGGENWLVAVFSGARGIELKKNTTLRLHFDAASCFNKDESVRFLLRVVFKNGKTAYASNSAEIADAAGGKTAKFVINREGRYFEGVLNGPDEGGVVREIAVDVGASTSHLPVPLNKNNDNNPRFSKLTVSEEI